MEQKLCLCGCGNEIPYKVYNERRNIRFIVGHNTRHKGEEIFWDGRYFVYCPIRKKRILRARIVMEKNIGRFLNSQEVVHHINQIQTDDRIENLELTDFATHIGNHRRLPIEERNRRKKEHSRKYQQEHKEELKIKRKPYFTDYGRKYRLEDRNKNICKCGKKCVGKICRKCYIEVLNKNNICKICNSKNTDRFKRNNGRTYPKWYKYIDGVICRNCWKIRRKIV